jgi:hypothetical protein
MKVEIEKLKMKNKKRKKELQDAFYYEDDEEVAENVEGSENVENFEKDEPKPKPAPMYKSFRDRVKRIH